MCPSPSVDPALIFALSNSFQKTATLRTAIELGLFAALGEGHSSIPELAERCQAKERGLRILCDFLTVTGLIEKKGEEYQHTPTSATFLDPQSPTCVASVVSFLNNPALMEPYDHLTDIIRQGYDAMPHGGTIEPENPVWIDFAHSMAPMMGPLAAPLGEVVLRSCPRANRILDVAAGHGLFGIEVAKQNPAAQVVALDWAAVLEVAKANAEKAGVSSRYSLKTGSAFEVDFEGPYDVILLTNFLHHFSVETNVGLLKKCAAALNPGGRVAALEFVPNPDRVTPAIPAEFALIMLATTPEGDAYTYPEYQAMFQAAGFAQTELHELPMGAHRIVVGFS